MSVVLGKDVLVLIFDAGIWKPYACGTSCTLDVATDFIEISTAGSNAWKEFEPTQDSYTGTINGVTYLEEPGKFTLPELRALQLAHRKLQIRFERTDVSGHVYTDQGYFYISNTRDVGSFDGLNVYDIELRGTGALAQVFTPAIQTPPIMHRYEYTGTGGEFGFTDASLIGKNIIIVHKDGIGNSKVITAGSPVDKEVLYNTATGELEWAIPFEPGEEAVVAYQDQ